MLCLIQLLPALRFVLFFFTAAATPQLYTLSLHDPLPIPHEPIELRPGASMGAPPPDTHATRSEEDTLELQSLTNLGCRVLLEKKNEHDVEIDGHGLAHGHHPATREVTAKLDSRVTSTEAI